MNHLKKLTLLMLAITLVLHGTTTTSYAKANTETSSANQSLTQTQAFVNVKSKLNLREKPSSSSKSLDKFQKGTILTIYGEADENGWYYVSHDNVYGYVKGDYLIFSDYPEYEMISAFSTTSKSSTNRDFNMALATSKINGMILEPDDTFDWFEVIGSANKANGYKKATIISGGKYVQGYGGGVCQVSTTLYNLIYQIDIIPDELHHHSLKSSYVPKGMDATVAYKSKNFVFTNSTESSILIELYTDGGTVYGMLYNID